METNDRILSDAELDAADELAEVRLRNTASSRRYDEPLLTEDDVERAIQAHRESRETSEAWVRAQELLDRPYRMEVRGDPKEGYLASAPELPGCVTAGETPSEALAMLRDAMAAWLETAILDGLPIPEPGQDTEERHSGRLLLRMPKSLHRALAEAADTEGVSTNQYVVALLAANVGGRVGPKTISYRRAVPAEQATFLGDISVTRHYTLESEVAAAVEEAVEAGIERALRRQRPPDFMRR